MVRSVEVFGSFWFIILHLSNRFHASLQWLAALGPWWVPGAGHAPEHGMGGRGYDRDPEKMVDTVETVDTLRSLCLDGVIINGERLSEISMMNYVIPIRWNELMNFVSRLQYVFARSKSVLDSTTTWHWDDIPVKCVFGSISQDLKMTLATSGSHCEITSFLGLHPFIP